jgi:hypothetical protein
VKHFYDECKAVMQSGDATGSSRFFIEALLATTEYETFYVLMKNEMQKYQKSADDGPSSSASSSGHK